jgi:hypothetical protein
MYKIKLTKINLVELEDQIIHSLKLIPDELIFRFILNQNQSNYKTILGACEIPKLLRLTEGDDFTDAPFESFIKNMKHIFIVLENIKNKTFYHGNPLTIMSNEYAQCLVYLDLVKYETSFFSFEYFEDELKVSINQGLEIVNLILKIQFKKILESDNTKVTILKNQVWYNELNKISKSIDIYLKI